jgi:hypothetical protein
LLLSVPFGVFENHRWFRQFGEEQLDTLLALLAPADLQVDVFRYEPGGWCRSERSRAAEVRYRPATDPPADDRAAAARAVVCVRARLPSQVARASSASLSSGV